jgi:hypothetical protein
MSGPTLVEEFNTSASRYIEKTDIPLSALLLRYKVLQDYKLGDDTEKKEITLTLYGCAIDRIKKFSAATPSSNLYFYEGLHGEIESIFDKVLETSGQPAHLPMTAPQDIATLALDLLRNIEKMEDKDFKNYKNETDYKEMSEYRANATQLATLVAGYADKFRNAISEVTGNISTSQPVTASKPIQLRHAGTQTP